MGYLHIENLYRDGTILLFKRCYALEKVHGTSAHVGWRPGEPLRFAPGAAKHATFTALFGAVRLNEQFTALFDGPVTVYGEAYGGGGSAGQAMSATYGKALCFIAFDVQVGDLWLSVPQAQDVCGKLGLEFVPWEEIDATIEAIDAARDADSIVAQRRGVVEPRRREGVVLRPLIELTRNNGSRVIVKHRRDEFVERQNQPAPTVDAARLRVLAAADAIAFEWVVPRRLEHVLQQLDPPATTIRDTGRVTRAMVDDVVREAEGEIIDSKEARSAIGRKAAELFHNHLAAEAAVREEAT